MRVIPILARSYALISAKIEKSHRSESRPEPFCQAAGSALWIKAVIVLHAVNA